MTAVRRFLSGDVLAVVWVAELVAIFWPAAPFRGAVMAVFGAYLVTALWTARRRTQITVAILVAVGAGLFPAVGGMAALFDGLRFSMLLAAFLPTLLLGRATAEGNREIARSRAAFAQVTGSRSSTASLLCSHALGGVLTVGAFALVAAIVPSRAAPEDRRRSALASLRGMGLAGLWSPFFFAMAVASHYVTGVPLWQTMLLGVPLALAGLVLAYVGFGDAGSGRGALRETARALGPVVPIFGLASAAVVLTTMATRLTSLQAVMLVVPVLCLLELLRRGRRELVSSGGAIVATTRGQLGRLNDDILLTTTAFVFGRTLESNAQVSAAFASMASLELPVLVVIAAAMAFMVAGAVVGIHPIVTMTLVLVTLGGQTRQLARPVLLELGLYGWSLGTMISMSSVSVAAAATMFGVPVPKLAFGENVRFVIIFGVLSAVLLALVNRVLLGG